ncbi:SAM-dependent methyltransferase [Paramecium bursaria Chlorella virus CvsA1]|nr:SAM-dependent methyltransferase [Paramecium bursaria Chlorella virus CviKI]AGE52587.1 SAM-dependent methyltransferase [Paramecium bursaria Chlorella virus CvsA1]AGE55381.1 SAM-dependent methyltransferase [Paramecium bursaria Chlorella virus MA1E]
MIKDAKISSFNRDHVIKYIIDKKNEYPFSVIDIGGSAGGWSSKVVDAVVDYNEADWHKERPEVKVFRGNICHPNTWDDVLEYVKINGLFDFCICTHTLEDISNPAFVCEQISKIAKGGYIAVPSKHRELAYPETPMFRGYVHHRWIFTICGNSFVGFPKIGYLEKESSFDRVADCSDHCADLSFFWEDSVKVDVINDDYLGPTSEAVISYYERLKFDSYM